MLLHGEVLAGASAESRKVEAWERIGHGGVGSGKGSERGSPMIRCIALDAMGVLFEAADEVAELLVPFVLSANPAATADDVESAYLAASLGDLTPTGSGGHWGWIRKWRTSTCEAIPWFPVR